MNEKKIYRIETCKFQREKDGEWENGIMINEGDQIFDSDGNIPPKIWDCRRWPGLTIDFSEMDAWVPLFNKWLAHIDKLFLSLQED